jgi:thiamine pyrophosphate-dependent acetolactate synthase large subunit-like protein
VTGEGAPALGARQLVDFLERHGHRHVFGLPGSSAVAFFHALQGSSVRYVQAVHEAAAVAMADGYSRVAGSACVMLYMMPGTANGLANLYNAWRDESPLLVLASQQRSDLRNGTATTGEADLVTIAAPFTRLAHELPGGASLEAWLERAMAAATGPPSGPVFLSVPEDLLEHPSPAASVANASRRVPPGAPDVAAVAERMRRAERPLIVVGGQLRRSGGADAVAELAGLAGAAVCYEPSWNEALGIAPGHPNALGPLTMATGRRLAAAADLVLLVGCRYFREAHPQVAPWFPRAELVGHVNLDVTRLDEIHPADWSCACDPRAFVDALTVALSALPPDPVTAAAREQVLDEARAARTDADALTGPYAGVSRALADVMDHTWLVDESVLGTQPLLACLRAEDGRRYMTTSGASLGWAPAAACGAALASGEPVTCLLGDGALLFGAQGLWTARAYDLPITFVVYDNGGYASTRMFERAYAARADGAVGPAGYIGSDLRGHGPSSAQVLEGFGIPTVTLDSEDALRTTIEAAWAREHGPTGIVVPIQG